MMDTIEESLDTIYGTPPVGTEALDKLRDSVQEWQDAIWYDALRDSPVGPLFVAVGNQGVVAIEFGTDEAGFVRELEARHGGNDNPLHGTGERSHESDPSVPVRRSTVV